jgi:hypothetical protein
MTMRTAGPTDRRVGPGIWQPKQFQTAPSGLGCFARIDRQSIAARGFGEMIYRRGVAMADYALWRAGIAYAMGAAWFSARRRYFRFIESARVSHEDGRPLPSPPQAFLLAFLLGNLATVDRALGRLAAYNGFHAALGEIVQIFWL